MICARCVIPDTFPGARLDEHGLCFFCRTEKPDTGARAAGLRERFARLAEEVRERSGCHCLLAYSGGKDSTYTLRLLTVEYGLRVLTVTFDNGFMSPQSLANVSRMTQALNAESIVVKPPRDALVAVFRSAMERGAFPAKALERASRICTGCIALVKESAMSIALKRDIPIVAYGWSPGQAPISAALFKLNAEMLGQMHRSRLKPLSEVKEALYDYLIPDDCLARSEFPYCVNPLAFHDYSEEEVLRQVASLGWVSPADTDGNSTNCLLNGLANRAHMQEFGFHPYAFEIAALVRRGAMPREHGIAKLADLGNLDMAKKVARELGIAFPTE